MDLEAKLLTVAQEQSEKIDKLNLEILNLHDQVRAAQAEKERCENLLEKTREYLALIQDSVPADLASQIQKTLLKNRGPLQFTQGPNQASPNWIRFTTTDDSYGAYLRIGEVDGASKIVAFKIPCEVIETLSKCSSADLLLARGWNRRLHLIPVDRVAKMIQGEPSPPDSTWHFKLDPNGPRLLHGRNRQLHLGGLERDY